MTLSLLLSSLPLSGLLRQAGWVVGGILAVGLLLVLLAGGGLFGANTDAGRAFLARTAAGLSGGQIRLGGITGHFPDDFRIAHVELTDADGVWLGIDDLALAWSPRRLLAGEVAVRNLTAARIAVARLPTASSGGSGNGSLALPLRVRLERLKIDRIDLAASGFGAASAFVADGSGLFAAPGQAEIFLSFRRLDQPGGYRLDARRDAAGLHARLGVHEPEDGLLATAAGVAKPGPVTLDAIVDGPPDALATHLVLDAGKLHAAAEGTVDLDRQSGKMVLTLKDLAPVAALAGLDLQGSTVLSIRGALTAGVTHLEADGPISLTAGKAPLPALIGGDTKLHLAADLHGGDIALTEVSLAGAAAIASAQGSLKGNDLDLDWTLALPELRVLAPALDGKVQAAGHVRGNLADLAIRADITGIAAPSGLQGFPITAHLEVLHLPDAPAATIAGAWRSARAQGDLTLPPGAAMPLGHLDVTIDRLADMTPLLGRPVSGALTAALDSTAQRASLILEARNVGLSGSAGAGIIRLAATIADPVHPVADMKLSAEALRLNAMPAPIHLTAGARVDIGNRQAVISTLEAAWNSEKLRLLNPVRVDFADTVSLDRLRLGLRQAVLEASGRVSPTLDLTASLRGVTPDLAALFVPGLQADGNLRADARLAGPPARPTGTVHIEANGLRARAGAARGLPPAHIGATANLTDGRANIDARLTAGSAVLTVNGLVPLSGGPIDLHAEGAANLALLDPLISAAGRRVTGQATVAANLRGTVQNPRIEGVLNVTNGMVEDYNSGLHLTSIAATLHGDGSTLRIDRFTARAGPDPGRIDIAGSIGVLAPGMPVDLTLTARAARPVSNDVLNATLDADLALRGQAGTELTLSGTIKLLRADIRIPERLPASVPVLHVIRPGARPPPPPAPGPDIRLGLTLDAPGQIFVRGRGLDAELGGRVRLTGTIANPAPDGRFQLVRGDFSLVGQTLAFSKGEIGFDGASVTDPSLNFLASHSGAVTANLAITGSARAPKITLSSSPPLPQDEVLSQLLFGRSAASLQPLELAQIAAALASLTGATSGLGDPLNSVRTGLGLDRLSIGNNGGGSTLDAGRYVSPGVYVGARQSLSGSGTQSVVQIDISRNLKVEGTVGTGTASATGTEASQGTGVAVIYEKDY